jgi:hypothetical protein
MLRISTVCDPNGSRFKLEGKLVHEWVNEAAKAWTTLLIGVASRGQVVVELYDISFVDDNGRALLCQMHAAGAKLVGCGPMIGTLIEEITGSNGNSSGGERTRGIVVKQKG